MLLVVLLSLESEFLEVSEPLLETRGLPSIGVVCGFSGVFVVSWASKPFDTDLS